MILLDANRRELGYLNCDVDVDVGTTEASTNDFEIVRDSLMSSDVGGFYEPGTEIGGMIEYLDDSTDSDATKFRGYTWRGLLSKGVIMPPAGSNYRVVSGEANSIIASLLNGFLGGFFTVSTEDSGLTISSYQFPLYVNNLDGIEGMLEKYGYRLKITGQKISSGASIQILLEAVQAQRVAGTYNQDNGIPMQFIVDKMGINHLICGGSGELQQRMIRHLYIDADGNVSTTQYYTGFQERTEFYDYANAESEDDLIYYGTQRLLEVASSKTLKMKAPDDYELDIGDLVQGTFPDGTVIVSPIVEKIYKISGGLLSVEYKIKGED